MKMKNLLGLMVVMSVISGPVLTGIITLYIDRTYESSERNIAV